jgi:hypothetical protein
MDGKAKYGTQRRPTRFPVLTGFGGTKPTWELMAVWPDAIQIHCILFVPLPIERLCLSATKRALRSVHNLEMSCSVSRCRRHFMVTTFFFPFFFRDLSLSSYVSVLISTHFSRTIFSHMHTRTHTVRKCGWSAAIWSTGAHF